MTGSGGGPAIKLLEHPLSPYAQKVRIFLREKGLPFESETPAAGGGGQRPGDVNPRAEVPVLFYEGHTIFDSTIILEFLEETFPIPGMMPKAPADRARMRMIEEICDTQWEAVNWGLSEVEFFKRGGDALGPVLSQAGRRDAESMYAWLEKMLGGNAWLTGERFGWGDVAALPHVIMTEMSNVLPASGSKVTEWLKRSLERPSVSKTVEEARSVVPAMKNAHQLIASGLFKRQFRDHRLEWMIRSGGIQVVLDGLEKDNIRFTDLSRFAGH
jgi:glutathione S-transferase